MGLIEIEIEMEMKALVLKYFSMAALVTIQEVAFVVIDLLSLGGIRGNMEFLKYRALS